MRYELPGATAEFTASGLATGLVGQLTIEMQDGQGSVVAGYEPTTAGIVEAEGALGVYTGTLVLPLETEQYVVIFTDPTSLRTGATTVQITPTGLPSIPVDVPIWAPTLEDVGGLLRARTLVDGVEIGTFNADTRPTGDAVQSFIANDGVGEVLALAGSGELHPNLQSYARSIATRRAALSVERSYYPEHSSQPGSQAESLQVDLQQSKAEFERLSRRYRSTSGEQGTGGVVSLPIMSESAYEESLEVA